MWKQKITPLTSYSHKLIYNKWTNESKTWGRNWNVIKSFNLSLNHIWTYFLGDILFYIRLPLFFVHFIFVSVCSIVCFAHWLTDTCIIIFSCLLVFIGVVLWNRFNPQIFFFFFSSFISHFLIISSSILWCEYFQYNGCVFTCQKTIKFSNDNVEMAVEYKVVNLRIVCDIVYRMKSKGCWILLNWSNGLKTYISVFFFDMISLTPTLIGLC